MYYMPYFRLFILAWLAGAVTLWSAPLQKKTLIIGVDGTMSQYLAVARTPNLNALKTNGVFTDRAITDPVTHSAACWSSMFTGVWGDKHGVQDPGNNMSSNKYALYPNFLRRLEQVNSNLNTVAYLRWCPLGDALAGTDLVQCFGSDASLVTAACNRLTNNNPDVFYTILLDVDSAGHSPGWGTATYVSAIETADARIGQIMSALTNRTTYTNEDWLVIVLADHGQHDSTAERSRFTFHLVWGSTAARGTMYPTPSIVDVCATVLNHMEVPIDPAWNLDARVEGLPLPARYGTNLIFNGDAESNSATNNFKPDRGIAWWWDYVGTTLGTYGANTNFLSSTNEGPVARGNNFFLGGTNRNTFISQTIDLSALADDIDGGGADYSLSAWLGGTGTESNSALFSVQFLTESNSLVGTNYVGPVTTIERGATGALLFRATNGTVPTRARLAEFTLRTTSALSTNKAAADNLSFVLVQKPRLTLATEGNGLITKTPDALSYTNDDVVVLTATPMDCAWRFIRWTDSCDR